MVSDPKCVFKLRKYHQNGELCNPPSPTWTCNWGTYRKGWGWKQRISLGNCVGRKSNTAFNVNPIDKIELDETCSTTSHGNWESTIDMYLKFEIAWIIEYMRVHLDDRLTGHHCLNVSASLLWGWELNITKIYSTLSMSYEMKSCMMTINIFNNTGILDMLCTMYLACILTIYG